MSNPITDILTKLYEAGVNAANQNRLMEDMERSGKVYGPGYKPATQAQQALYEAVVKSLPQKYDTTHSYSDRLARNKALDEVLTNLSLLFGVPLGNLDESKAINSQPQLADNPSEEG